MELSTPAGFLADPDTAYPVTIDPDINAVSLTQDTWVRSGTSSVDTLLYRLLVGRISSHSSDMPAHSYIQWSNTELASRSITKATMNLYQYGAGSCSDKRMNIHPLEGSWNENTTWYANKPNGVTNTGTSTYLTEMRGASGCAATNGFIGTDIAPMAQAWANGASNGGFENKGVQLNVPSESGHDDSYERRFCSSEPDTTHTSCNSASRVPYLSITYYAELPSESREPLVDAMTRASNGVASTEDVSLIESYNLLGAVPASEPALVTTEDELEEPLTPESDDAGTAEDCDVAQPDCDEGTDSVDEPIAGSSSGTTSPSFYRLGVNSSIVTSAGTVGNCASGETAKRYTKTMTKKNWSKTDTIFKWSHRVQYCIKSGKVTRWRYRSDWTSHENSYVEVRGLQSTNGGIGSSSANSWRKRKIQYCGPLVGCWATGYPWSKLTVSGNGGKTWKGEMP